MSTAVEPDILTDDEIDLIEHAAATERPARPGPRLADVLRQAGWHGVSGHGNPA